jgi:AcrR family transcriptional regulator
MARNPAQQPTTGTRDRILKAALRRFSHHSYEATGLRDIAGDVGVDVAYVHRCFGSKEKLFAEAIQVALQARRFAEGEASNLSTALARRLVAEFGETSEEIEPMDIIIRSLSSFEATRVLRTCVQDELVDRLARHLDPPAQRRAALIAAFLMGVGILRNVLHLEPLIEPGGGELENLIAQCLTSLMRTTGGQVHS